MKQLVLFALLTTAAGAQQKPDTKLPEGPGKALTEKVCSGCHGLENVVRARMTKERWNTIVEDMVSRGATATDEEIDKVVAYLAANFSKPASSSNPKAQEEPKP
jgi:mono/diheme cytochrome c family protein